MIAVADNRTLRLYAAHGGRSRHWHRVSKPIQKLAADLYPIMTEGMFPYEIYYVLATDEEIQRLSDSAAIGL